MAETELWPATRRPVPGRSVLGEEQFRAVADDQAVGAGAFAAAGQGHVFADQAFPDTFPDVPDAGVVTDDRVLHLGVADRAVPADRRERPDVGVFDDGAGTDDGRTENGGITDRGSFSDHDVPRQFGLFGAAVDGAAGFHQHEAVGVQDVFGFAGVLPPAFHLHGFHEAALLDEAEDGVRNLVLILRARLELLDYRVDRPVEHVHAGDRQVARRYFRFFHELGDAAVFDDRHAQLAGIFDRHERQDGVDALVRPECFPEGADAVLEQVVAQVHHEIVVAEEIPGHFHGVGESARRRLDYP